MFWQKNTLCMCDTLGTNDFDYEPKFEQNLWTKYHQMNTNPSKLSGF